MNTKLESLNFEKVEDGKNNSSKTICEVVDGVLGNKVMTTARNIREKAFMLNRRRGGCLYKYYLSDRSYEKKRNVKKVEKTLKYELRKCDVEARDKIFKDLEDGAR